VRPKRQFYLVYLPLQKPMITAIVVTGIIGFISAVFLIFIVPRVLSALSLEHQIPSCRLDALQPHDLLGVLVGFSLFVFGAVIWGVYMSHKVAGPIYKMNEIITERSRGERTGPMAVRANCLGSEFIENINSYLNRQDEIYELTKKVLEEPCNNGSDDAKKLSSLLDPVGAPV